MEHSNLHVVLGPPGTGKTTKLLNLVENHLNNGILPDHIGYLAFTKKAATEAIDRACVKFDYQIQQLPYFRTIHSLCFQLLGLKRDDVMGKSHYKELGEMLGIEITGASTISEGASFGMTNGDRLFFLENLARIKRIPLRQVYDESNDEDINWFELERLQRALISYKKKRKVVDYTDMLQKSLEAAVFPKIRVLFVDEAQDLSKLQWDVIQKIGKETEVIYVAGDDDQAIYRWAGADVDQFIGLNGNHEVLDTSYRVPKTIWELGTKLSLRIKQRKQKQFKPKKSEGRISWYLEPEDVDISKGQWYLLARNGYMLKQLETICVKNGYPYSIGYRSPLDSEALQAIRYWTRWSKGESILGSGVKVIYRYMVTRCPRGIDPDKYYSINDFGLKPIIWHSALNKLDEKNREYYIALLRRGESLKGKPRIKISTIHGVKGGEADNVMLLTDIAPRTYREMHATPDDELRVFYVAVTRAKENLHIVQPQTNTSFLL